MNEHRKLEPKRRGGEASQRVVHALAAEFPRMHDRESFLKSQALKEEFGDRLPYSISAIKKTLARLSHGHRKGIKEVLWLCGNDPRVNLPAAGMIAVSVDIGTLREEEWMRAERRRVCETGEPLPAARGPMLPDNRPPTQESIVEEIVVRTRSWIREHTGKGVLPIAVTNINIVHGSDAFDILVNVSLAAPDHLLRYAREVIQRIPHVRGTHSMLLSSGYGFSNPV